MNARRPLTARPRSRPGRDRVRTAAKAVVIRSGALLTIEKRDHRGHFYILPGGGQRLGETIADALVRECREELGCAVRLGPLLFVRDYIAAHHEFARTDAGFHQLEFIFACDLEGPVDLSLATELDRCQQGVAWLSLPALPTLPFYPRALGPLLQQPDWREQPCRYLGDIN